MLLDDSVRSRQHLLRNYQTDLFRGLQIDHQLKLRRLLDRQVGGLSAFQDFVNVGGGTALAIPGVRTVGHESTGIYGFAVGVHRR